MSDFCPWPTSLVAPNMSAIGLQQTYVAAHSFLPNTATVFRYPGIREMEISAKSLAGNSKTAMTDLP